MSFWHDSDVDGWLGQQYITQWDRYRIAIEPAFGVWVPVEDVQFGPPEATFGGCSKTGARTELRRWIRARPSFARSLIPAIYRGPSLMCRGICLSARWGIPSRFPSGSFLRGLIVRSAKQGRLLHLLRCNPRRSPPLELWGRIDHLATSCRRL